MAFDDEELGYNSSQPSLMERTKEVIQDERDLPALKQLQSQLAKDIKSYSTIKRLVLGSKTFTVEQQLAINASIVSHLEGYKATIDNAIANVKEAMEETNA
jgi:hypothetical protein